MEASGFTVTARNSTFAIVLSTGSTASVDLEGGHVDAQIESGTLAVRRAACSVVVSGGIATIDRSHISQATVSGGNLHVTDSEIRAPRDRRLLDASGGFLHCERTALTGGSASGPGGAVLVQGSRRQSTTR